MVFDWADADGSGKLSMKELQDTMAKIQDAGAPHIYTCPQITLCNAAHADVGLSDHVFA